MGQIENMTETDVAAFHELANALKERNKELTFKTFPQEDLDFAKRLSVIEEKQDKILLLLKHIFGPAVLIDGKWVKSPYPF